MKLFATFIFLAFVSFASESSDNLRVQILEKIITEISVNKEIKVWSDNKNILNTLKSHNILNTTDNCEDASIIILQEQNNLLEECSSKTIFVLNYEMLSEIPKSFGALFWKKGRPNIVILKSRIKAQSIQVSNDLKPYLEEKIW
ncbi:hypothetical protein SMGD1_0704 [Sulfurimonas gotlandica GD1]|jgi:Cdc6-like AAA superfamily ATPase|uniref:Periplasmic protein n=1 Tax=Sulfurimonas gotlandica (strain DSM 19862 / JCM 16533 / GD1) TaxID=929558 RepID=H1FWB3_SULGG|nr:hypothetical protein [Sulfurimonas gotlandica]EHP29231.1 hypothetical protein SMGD1_0704 [Sulfurimonas gotlandica GD1]